MCDQTEINYLDGDVVWVKLGACWWPGQVTGIENLPDDLKLDFKKKPPIAAVKFFQENTYEFVKNFHQIYNYNCTRKDEFIKKGLDKYRSKRKDGSNLMDKFPGDVEIAEKSTGGDPEILRSEKFCPEAKPDISSLFGEKKLPKKKQRIKEGEMMRHSYGGNDAGRKIVSNSRFFKENDHEIRIRHQPTNNSHSTTPNTNDGQFYLCPLCSFTSTRVNVIISHSKSHSVGPAESPISRSSCMQPIKSRSLGGVGGSGSGGSSDTQKRKYVRKNKSLPRMKNDRDNESLKRKHQKQVEKSNKKKKSDPEIKELLADWDDGSDDDMDVDLNKSTDASDSIDGSPVKDSRKDLNKEMEDDFDDNNTSILLETEKLLKETEDLPIHLENSKNKILSPENAKESTANVLETKIKSPLSKFKESVAEEKKNSTFDKDQEKKSKFSCFDFEDEEPEPAMPPVRKIPRVFGEKNTSLKKELIKEFTMSQAMANEKEIEEKKMIEKKTESFDDEQKHCENIIKNVEKPAVIINESERSTSEIETSNNDNDEKLSQKIDEIIDETDVIVEKLSSESECTNKEKSRTDGGETQLEIVEILEIEREKVLEEEAKLTEESEQEKSFVEKDAEMREESSPLKNLENQIFPSDSPKKSALSPLSPSPVPILSPKAPEVLPTDPKKPADPIPEEIPSDRVTIESEEEPLPISQLIQSKEAPGDDSMVDDIGWSQLHEIIGSSGQTGAIKDELIQKSPQKDAEKDELIQKSPQKDAEKVETEEEDEDQKKEKEEKSAGKKGDPQQKQQSLPEEKPARRRGRPRKYPLQTELTSREEVPMKIDDSPLPRTPDSQDTDRKTSESDGERSYTGRKRKPNKKYMSSDIYTPSPERRTPKTDESQSETEEKPLKEVTKGKRGRKPSRLSKNVRKSIEEYEFSDQTLDSAEEIAGISTPTPKSPLKSSETIKKKSDTASPVHITDLLSTNDIEIREMESLKSQVVDAEAEKEEKSEKLAEVNDKMSEDEEDKQKIEILPPKKSQIKKFEQSQMDSIEQIVDEPNEPQKEPIEIKEQQSEEKLEIIDNEINQSFNQSLNVPEKEAEPEKVSDMSIDEVKPPEIEENNSEAIIEETIENIVIEEVIESEKDDSKLLLSLSPSKSENVDDITEFIENPDMSFDSDHHSKIHQSQIDLLKSEEKIMQSNVDISGESPKKRRESMDAHAMTRELASLEADLTDKPEDTELPQNSSDQPPEIPVSPPITTITPEKPEIPEKIDPPKEAIVSVPVKKREKPRIIENVALKEPMQILKSKLLEKQPPKPSKHKLEAENILNKNETIGASSAKMMKLESSSPSNSKSKSSPTKIKSSPLTITKKLQVLKTEEALENIPTNTISIPVSGTQNLSEMELDINSIPFVMSEDLNPDNIEQMPVMISSIMPPTSCATATATALPTAMTTALPVSAPSPKIAVKNQVQSSNNSSTTHLTSASPGSSSTSLTTTTSTGTNTPAVNETNSEVIQKKKTAAPTILKQKAKGKPTITSIKTLVPPLTGGVKGLKFQTPTQQTSKAMPVLTNQKCTPGKYVIVQTAAGQKVRYTVQGKSTYPHQKIPISACSKTAATSNPQIVQQGGKVVIITSPQQGGQQKVVPLNVQKGIHGGKVQKIVGTKANQVFTQLNSPKSTIISPKNDINSPTTSKLLTDSQKIVNTSVIGAKGILTSISGAKTLLSSIPQQLLSKGGVITQLSSSSLAGKTIIGQKAIVTNKGTFFAHGGISTHGGTKTILAPITQTSLTGKTLLTSHSLVAGKGAVLTPFTGQQVKAMAAKSPAKSPTTKVQYQQLAQKIQLPMLQKKITISPGSNMRLSGQLKSPGTIILQNSPAMQQQQQQQQQQSPKILATGKKYMRQSAGSSTAASSITTSVVSTSSIQQNPAKSMQTVSQPQPLHQKSKSTPSPRAKQSKHKLLVQKIHQQNAAAASAVSASVSSVDAATQKSSASQTSIMTSIIKTPTSTNQKAAVSTAMSNKSARGTNKNLQKHLLASVTHSTSTSPSLQPSIAISPESGPLEDSKDPKKPDNTEINVVKPGKIEPTPTKSDSTEDALSKIEEEKVGTQSAQPQIMALPTESADGTQTYVLVTIDEQGQIQPLDNNTLMSLEGTTPNADGSRTLYIDPSSLDPSGTLDNIVLQFDNNAATSGCSTLPVTHANDPIPTVSTGFQSSNQDILAAALANTDFQQEICLPETSATSVMSTGLSQTNLDTQTILQSTLIPSAEPISSPSVLETSLTLNQPIMTPLEVPSSVAMQLETSAASISAIPGPQTLELPLTVANASISYASMSSADLKTTVTTGPDAVQTATAAEADTRIPGNSMPDIGEIMDTSEASIEVRKSQEISSQYLVISDLEGSNSTSLAAIATSETSIPTVSYGISSISDGNTVVDGDKIQTTPSMPIIDDSFVDSVDFSSKLSTSRANEDKLSKEVEGETKENEEIGISQGVLSPEIIRDMPVFNQEEEDERKKKEETEAEEKKKEQKKDDAEAAFDLTGPSPKIEENDKIATDSTIIASISSEKQPLVESSVSESASVFASTSESPEAESITPENSETSASTVAPELMETDSKTDSSTPSHHQQEDDTKATVQSSTQPITEALHTNYPEVHTESTSEVPTEEKNILELSQEEETPSQSYEKFNPPSTITDSIISQSTSKSSSTSEEATQSIQTPYKTAEVLQPPYKTAELDKICTEPPSQSFEDTGASQSCVTISQSTYESSNDATNAPTQSFNQIIHSEEERMSPTNDDTSFPTQSYEVGKIHDNLAEVMETDGEISQEGNIPSQSNDVGTDDGIGTSTFSSNNTGFNEDETASSSYVPETPENQERDQDQESAISTSSYEIPPCEEINIATSSVIPDTSVHTNTEHSSIHDNGVPEIPTSSYSLNPDSSSASTLSHVDAVPTSSYEDQIIVEQNVSTSYEVAISMPGLEENANSSQNFVSESSDQRNEPSSYYTSNPEEVTSEPSQSYFVPEDPSPSYTTQTSQVSPSYYDGPQHHETEASQSYYSTQTTNERNDQSSSGNNESASQSFYQEQPDEMRMRPQGEATPTYTERYSADYSLDNSPIDRHDLVESSVPANKPAER